MYNVEIQEMVVNGTHGVYIKHWPFQVFSWYKHFSKLNLHKVQNVGIEHTCTLGDLNFRPKYICTLHSSVFFL